MGSQLLEIQPQELQFVFELKKQSSCSIQLVNKTQHHVAFKVKTTSPKKYCVRPNVGVVMPKSTCEFNVTMQAQRSFPPDMICKDKFLIQSTVVPAGTTDEDITTEVFSKDEGKFIQENKLRVALISPPESPVLSPINGASKQGIIEAPNLKNHNGLNGVDFVKPEPVTSERHGIIEAPNLKGHYGLNGVDFIKQEPVISEKHGIIEAPNLKGHYGLNGVDFIKQGPVINEKQGMTEAPHLKGHHGLHEVHFFKPQLLISEKQGPIEAPNLKDHDGLNEVDSIKPEPTVAKPVDRPKVVNDEQSPENDMKVKLAEEVVVMKVAKDVEPYVKNVNLYTKDDLKGITLVNDIAEIKKKISELESNLSGAELTISKLTEERKSSNRERETLKEELALLRSGKDMKTIHDGFPLLFVVMVALISLTFGYLSH